MAMPIWIMLPVGLLIVIGLVVAVVFYFSGAGEGTINSEGFMFGWHALRR